MKRDEGKNLCGHDGVECAGRLAKSLDAPPQRLSTFDEELMDLEIKVWVLRKVRCDLLQGGLRGSSSFGSRLRFRNERSKVLLEPDHDQKETSETKEKGRKRNEKGGSVSNFFLSWIK
jgi:hypothetical protein